MATGVKKEGAYCKKRPENLHLRLREVSSRRLFSGRKSAFGPVILVKYAIFSKDDRPNRHRDRANR